MKHTSTQGDEEPKQTISLGNCRECNGTYAIVSDVPSTQLGMCDGCLSDQGIDVEEVDREHHRLQNLREQERMAQEYRERNRRRDAALLANHTPETFSVFKS